MPRQAVEVHLADPARIRVAGRAVAADDRAAGYFGEGPAGRDYPMRLARAKALARYFGFLAGPNGALLRERGKTAGAVRSTR